MQIIVSKIAIAGRAAVDPTDESKGGKDIESPTLNEVVRAIGEGTTASVSGDDILITPDTIYSQVIDTLKIVEVDSLPDGFKANKYTYDGSTWELNSYYEDVE